MGRGSRYRCGQPELCPGQGRNRRLRDPSGTASGRPYLAHAGRTSNSLPLRRQLPAEDWVIEGAVNANLEAAVALTLEGPTGGVQEIEAVVDTGFNGYLTLPPVLVEDMRLPTVGDGEAILADGSEATFDVHRVMVVWDGRPMHVETAAVGVDPLVGMALLHGHNLNVDIENGGRVQIRANA
ncbi:MAG: clan AA aspartic protease [Dehalococcoidia bacterium]|nr:clan AA aspartic protease [Dehalococcoidia bacterium]MYI86211.1 clan AA aspartic protease [Dehalococcoidia bacterium]